ncbi:MAG: phage tail sheath subtilisin-like domain-containing protein [Oscillospiraceae bacterium]|nr:phage tail sheath subtilisin-like domain-containing protein [Oscillospiraceae bacterium]
MAAFFNIGEKKTRPGVYFRYENYGTPPAAGADDGVCAVTVRSNWGPVGEAVLLEGYEAVAKTYGSGGANGTTDAALQEFYGGAQQVYAVRLGSGGTNGGYSITAPADPSAEGWYTAGTNSYVPSADTAREDGKVYYTVSATKVTPGSGDAPATEGWYELDGSTGTYTKSTDTEAGEKDYYELEAAAATALTADVITMTMKHPGSRQFSVTIRPTLADPSVTELLFLEGTEQLERLEFSNAGNSVDALMEAFGEAGGAYFTLTKIKDNPNALTSVAQAPITPGTDPSVTNASYSAAFEALEPYRWNVLALDTEDASVQGMMQLFLNRIYQGGRCCMGVVGCPTTAAFATRLVNAAAFNDYQVVYVGNGFVGTDGIVYEGYRAAARVAGMIAGTPGNESVTHAAVSGAASLSEALSNAQIIQALKSGMLVFSASAAGAVWVEQGINTLVSPGQNDDEGWKKIKRVKVRFELFQRLNDSAEALVGRVNNDPDGRATVIQVSNGVCNAMIAEKKLLAGARVEEDADNPPQGDSAWFTVYADDADSMEKLYFTFKFRFAPESAD